jgi:uncharacterized protein YbjQ (UPF0145 family)
MRKLLILASFAAVTGCVTTRLSPAAETVRLTTNPEAVRGCELVGDIDASDRMQGGMMGQMAAEENANRRLRNKAVEMGANVVLVGQSTTGMSGSRVRGEAYRCAATSPTP